MLKGVAICLFSGCAELLLSEGDEHVYTFKEPLVKRQVVPVINNKCDTIGTLFGFNENFF